MRFLKAAAVLALCTILPLAARAQSWLQVGPPGGDVRSLAADPRDARVLYLGTSDGHVFTSTDSANHWRLLGRVGSPDTVVFTLLVDRRDSSVIYAGTWPLGRGQGGVYRSSDGGETWKPAGLTGQTVRAIVQVPSDSETLLAATLDGVYRSRDDGKNWERISPEKHADLLNFDSLAVDPRDPAVIYAGTYHLAWKTADAGRSWSPIHAGMIDDSDVMSIVLDHDNPDRIFATACSGIYRSAERGERWNKIQGIPFTARRTHFIRQDPANPRVFYAGTTQGLWKSEDDTLTWKRITSADWSIIGLITDAKRPGRLVIGLERRGIVVSEDGGATFHTSNTGFDHQQTLLFAMDPAQPERMLVVLTNAADPVLSTDNGGRTWRPLGAGLKPELTHQVFAARDEWWATLERGGLLRYDIKSSKWVAAGMIQPAKAAVRSAKNKKAVAAPTPKLVAFKERVLDMGFSAAAWYAATPRGMYVSRDRGRMWAPLSFGIEKPAEVLAVRVSPDGRRITALTARGLLTSADAGAAWSRSELPLDLRGALRLDDAAGTLLLASDSGLYLSGDRGATWLAADLRGRRIGGFVAVEDTYLVSTEHGLHLSRDHGQRWTRLSDTEAEGRFPFLVRMGETETVLAASSTEGLRTVALSAQVSGNRPRPARATDARGAAAVTRQQP